MPANTTGIIVEIAVASGVTVPSGTTYYPMAYKGTKPAAFAPYHPSVELSKWDKSSQKVAGAYNLLPNGASSAVVNGLTFTVNADKTVTVNGTSTAVTSLAIQSTSNFNIKDLNADYKVVGCPSGGSSNTYHLEIDRVKNGQGGMIGRDNGNGLIITKSDIADITGFQVAIVFNTGITANNLVFKPMLTPDLNATYDDYVPYCMSNRELMEDLFVDPTAATFAKNSTNFTESAEFTITQDGLYYVYLQQNVADTGSALLIYKNNTSEVKNNLAIKRTVGVAYDSVNIFVPIKAGTKLIFVCNNSNLECSYKVIRHSI